MKSIPEPLTAREKGYAREQEGRRKDVERAFGRLHAKWHIIKHAGRSHRLKHLKGIWLACIILHNMTLRDMQSAELERREDDANALIVDVDGDKDVPHPGFQPLRDSEFRNGDFEGVLGNVKRMENKGMCHIIHLALVEHVWQHSQKKGV